MKNQNIKLKLYTATVILIGVIFTLVGIKEADLGLYAKICFFISVGALTQSLQIRVKNNGAISISFTIGLATVFIFKPSIVSLIGFFTMLVYIDNYNGKIYHLFNSDIYKRLFNGSAYALALGLSAIVYNMFGNIGVKSFELSVLGIFLSILIYAIVNTTIYTLLMCILENKKLRDAFKGNRWGIVNFIALSPLGVVTAIVYMYYGWFAVVMFLGPLLIARYSFKLYIDMKSVYFETIKALSNAVEAKDEYTQGHSYRVAKYAVGIAEEMGLDRETIEKINTAAILHDIGKIGISDSILNKPDNLSDEEFIRIQNHPEIGAKILVEVDFLKDVAEIIKHHHERYDGKGYPMKLKGSEISIESTILSVADAYDAMTSDRAYRKAMDPITAHNIILMEAGKQFDPMVVENFIKFINKCKNHRKEEIIESEQMSYVS